MDNANSPQATMVDLYISPPCLGGHTLTKAWYMNDASMSIQKKETSVK